jgi:cell division protease FtsH
MRRLGLIAATMTMLFLGVLATPALASASTTPTTDPSSLSNLVSPGTIDPSAVTLPKGYHFTSLGDLVVAAAKGQVPRATVNTALSVVLYVTGTHRDAAVFVTGSQIALVNKLLAEHVNVTVSTNPTLSAIDDGSSLLWQPLVIVAVFMLLMVFFMIRSGLWKRPRFRRRKLREAAGIHTASGEVSEAAPVTFANVAGQEEAVAAMADIVDFLRAPERYKALGATMPKGALLIGPPGTGKTLLARAVAGEAGVPFFPVSGSEFIETFVGVGPKRIRELFATARKSKRAIIFIDEVDAVARKRTGAGQQASDQESDRTLNQLLVEIDGFHKSTIIVIAATNLPEVLDPALTRSGRLDHHIEVTLPDRRAREEILVLHAATRPLDSDVDLGLIARKTAGLSGADLEAIINDAAITAARRQASALSTKDLSEAVMTAHMGRARTSALVTDHDRTITAWHEAGHTICAFLQEAADDPLSTSIIPRGPAGGVTAMSSSDDHFLQRSKAAAQLINALGGRVAEELFLGNDYTQGAHNDLRVATELATAMVTNYAMTADRLRFHAPSTFAPGLSDDHAAVVESLLAAARDAATELMLGASDFLRGLSQVLLDDNTIELPDVERVYQACGSPSKIPIEDTFAQIYGTVATQGVLSLVAVP